MRKWMVLGVFAALVFGGTAQPVEAGCFTDLADCFQRAANIDSFWYRWAAGLDCELDFIECTRVKLVGS